MANNPYSGGVPLNHQQDLKKAKEATSYRPGISHTPPVRDQYTDPKLAPRNVGCTPLRRYPNGKLDVKYVAGQIIDLIHKVQNAGKLTEFEKALLTSILPATFQFHGMDTRLAGTHARMSDEEKILVAMIVNAHLKEEENWNAGLGGGSVPGRHVTRS